MLPGYREVFTNRKCARGPMQGTPGGRCNSLEKRRKRADGIVVAVYGKKYGRDLPYGRIDRDDSGTRANQGISKVAARDERADTSCLGLMMIGDRSD